MSATGFKIFMCCHKGLEITPPCCTPIQCGRALNPPVEGMPGDDTGDSISRLNREYCELTAHYHAWKNVELSHYGFCHYRRFFGSESATKRPYIAVGTMSETQQRELLVSEEQWCDLLREYDIIAPRSEDMGLPAGEHYRTAPFHYGEDLDKFLHVLAQKAPELSQDAESYLAGNRQYFCNMFVMDKVHFYEYCGILFPVLEEFDRVKTLHGDFQSDRTDGYLGEIFTGIYISSQKRRGVSIKELPRVDAGCGSKKRALYTLLPPESRRRFLVKKLVKRLR